MHMMNKKSIKKALLACVAVMAAMALLLCGCGKSSNDNDQDSGNKKNPGSKEPVKETVMSTDLVEQATAMYGDILSLYKDVMSGESKIYTSSSLRLTVGDDFKDLVADLLAAEGVDDADAWLDIADGLTVGIDAGWQGDLMELMLSLGHADNKGNVTNVIDVDCIADVVKGDVYLAIPALLKGYFTTSVDMGDMVVAFDDLEEQWAELEAQLAEIEGILPSEELVGDLLAKYVEIALDELDIDESVKKVKANGVEQKLTVLDLTITEQEALDVAIAVLKAVKKDADIEEWLKDAAAYFEVGDTDEIYDEFVEELEWMIEDLEDYDNFLEDTYIDLTLYMNDAGAFVGVDVAYVEDGEREDVFYCLTTADGDEFGFEAGASDMFEVVGSGSENKGAVDATFDFAVDGEDIMQVQVINYTSGNGIFRFVPNADLISEYMDMADMPNEVAVFVAMLDVGLQIEIKSDDNQGELGLYLMDKDEVLIGFALAGEITDKEIKIPTSDVYTEEEIMELLATLDVEQLLKTLKKIGVPTDLVDELEGYVAMLEMYSGMLGTDFEDSFDSLLGDYELAM